MNFLEERIVKDGIVKEGNVLKVASLGLNISGEKFEAAASGNGPVDAVYRQLGRNVCSSCYCIPADLYSVSLLIREDYRWSNGRNQGIERTLVVERW